MPPQGICFCFPGQLLEMPSLDNGILSDTALTRDIAKTAFDLTGFKWPDLSFQDSALNRCINLKLQITSYLISVIYYRLLRQQGIEPDCITEHSMGIYAALVAAEIFTFEEVLLMVFEIGQLLEKKAQKNDCAMASIIGLPEDNINSIIDRLKTQKLFIANYNGSRNFVLSGQRQGILSAIQIALEQHHAVAAQELVLNVPLHCELLQYMHEDISNLLCRFKPNPPRIALINHLTAEICSQAEITRLLCEEIYKPVYWEKCVEKIAAMGIRQFVEVGYGETLFKLVRWIDSEMSVMNIRDKRSISTMTEKLQMSRVSHG